MFQDLLVFSPLLLLPILFLLLKFSNNSKPNANPNKLPKSYPIIGSFPSIYKNADNRLPYFTDLIKTSPTSTITLHHSFNTHLVVTANPSVVQHILKTNFHNYPKGPVFRTTVHELLGDGIFSADGDNWKFQRQLASHEFNTKSLRKFVEDIVDTELEDRLIPILAASAAKRTVLDFQDILQRFAFDNICRIAFGYDPEYLLPSLPQAKFAVAFDDAVHISGARLNSMRPLWKIKRALGVGSERHLRRIVADVREFANTIVRQKKREMEEWKILESPDLLSRFLSSGHSDEKFVTDIVISFTLAGRDTTSAALTWFFWLVALHANVESEILKEINESTETKGAYEEAKNMVYTHAALCESMRLYPPVPTDGKEPLEDDVLPDGTKVKKGMTVLYHVYSYPVFQAGPRICLGKEMAFLQMKRVVGGVLKRFRVVPEEREVEPVYVAFLTAKMKGGFPVTFVERA